MLGSKGEGVCYVVRCTLKYNVRDNTKLHNDLKPKACGGVLLTLTISQPSTLETESEEYRSHNNTESDIEVQEKGEVVIEDVKTVRTMIELYIFKNIACVIMEMSDTNLTVLCLQYAELPTPSEVSTPAV